VRSSHWPARIRSGSWPAQQPGRRGGVTLIVVLLFLLVLGVAIGLALAYFANVPLWPGSASQ